MFKIVNEFIKLFVILFCKLPFVSSKVNETAVKKTAQLYKGEGFTEFFSSIRFWDGPFREIESMVPKSGFIVDLGCGEGILTNYLAIKEKRRKLLGIEIDKKRVSQASRGLKNVRFKNGSALTSEIPKTKTIILSHMLHHLPSYDSQIVLIGRCRDSLRIGGKLVIAEIDRGLTLKYLLGWIVDGIVVPILFEGTFTNFNFYHRSKKDWKRVLTKEGFKVNFKKPLLGRPFPDLLIEATKVAKN